METAPARPEGGRTTLAAVAIQADVSIATVSKVLNGRGGVSPETRARVETLLHEHGYYRRNSPQAAAPLIEIVFSAIDSMWAYEIVLGAERVARENGLSLVITESGDRHAPSPAWIEGALRRRPAGVILVFGDLPEASKTVLRTRNIPFVVVDPAGDPAPDVPAIGSTNWTGGYSAGRHLVELGHRRIAVITGPDDQVSSTARMSGFRSALEGAGISIDPAHVRQGTWLYEHGLAAARALLRMPDRATAIFAGNDQQALGVYEAARELGISIPDELSVVGYDDLPFVQWVGPALTTVRQPLQEMAAQATRLVLRLREHPVNESMRIDLATRLVVRSSTAVPADA